MKIHPELHNPARALKSARIGKKDRPVIAPFSIQDAETLIAALHHDWGEAQGNYDEFRFFTGLRPSEQLALVVTDYDAVNGVLSVTKARVAGVDRDRTKTREDRRVVLCPRARCVLERKLTLHRRLQRAGCIDHDYLFVHADGRPIRHLTKAYARWRKTLKRLGVRYRKPYAARHSSVSWNLMIGRNPLFVAKQQGHSVLTMLSVYATWTDGALPADMVAIRRAMRSTASLTTKAPGTSVSTPRNVGFGSTPASRHIAVDSARTLEKTKRAPLRTPLRRSNLAIDLPVATAHLSVSRWNASKRSGGADARSWLYSQPYPQNPSALSSLQQNMEAQ